MPSSARRRTLSLESLESRITPAVLGLTLPLPVAELTSQVGLASPALSLALPSAGQPGVSLGVDVGILSLHAGVGSGGSLLSLGGNLDLPLVPPLTLQAAVGSPQGLLSVGVEVDPPALPPAPGGVLPPPGVPVSTPPAPSPSSPPVSMPGGTGSGIVPLPVTASQTASGIVPLPVAASQTATPAGVVGTIGAASALDIGVTNLVEPAGTGDDSPATTLHSPQYNDLTFASFSALRARPNAVASPRAESGGDDLEEESFSLRDGELLEDFGVAAAADAALSANANGEAFQGENANQMSLWLVGVLAGGVAGSAWLPFRRKEEEAGPVDAHPCLPPLE